MSNTLAPESRPAPDLPGAPPARSRTAKRIWIAVVLTAVVGAVLWGLVLLAWMVDETRFDRPSEEFEAFAAEVASLPGVESVDTERWVEAPTFSDPTSVLAVTVQQSGLPALLETACTADYPDPISWGIVVRTPSAAEVTLNGGPAPAAGGGDGCLDFGYDAVPLVAELDRVAPGVAIAPAAWREGTLSLVESTEVPPAGYTALLPLVDHSEDLLVAAGFSAAGDVEINSATLGMILEPGESDAYLRLLTELAEDHGVTSFWASSADEQTDGVAKVQVVAPDSQHAAIEDAIRSSGLRIAELPVRFLEQ